MFQVDRYSDDVAERFWAQVDRSGGPNECWSWTGPVRSDGYGVFNVGVRSELVHRLALELSGVYIPPGHVAMQLCGNRLCCHPHPEHLRLGTRSEQMARRSRLRRVSKPEEEQDSELD
jgi:hypothetical protein